MTTNAPQSLAYRCSRCFQIRCNGIDTVGQQVTCDFCGNENIVPEATEQRVAQALEFLSSATGEISQGNDLLTPEVETTDEEIRKSSRDETLARSGPGPLASSCMLRFLGALIDGFAMMVAMIMGTMLSAFIAPQPEDAVNLGGMLILFIVPGTLMLIQMVLTANEGRTLGKYCLNMKIVDADGNPPGFLRGVGLRWLANGLLAFVPFYSLVDSVWIFTNDSKRCLHDLIAGTWVIDA